MDRDIISFSKLFDGYRQQFVRFANSYVRDWQTAEDFVMDAMFEYWKNRESLHTTNDMIWVLHDLISKELDGGSDV